MNYHCNKPQAPKAGLFETRSVENEPQNLANIASCGTRTNVLSLNNKRGGAVMEKMATREEKAEEVGLLREEVHTARAIEINYFVAQLSDEEIILLDALLSSLE